jgi:hypothetical protein
LATHKYISTIGWTCRAHGLETTNTIFGHIVKVRNDFRCISLGWENVINVNLKVIYYMAIYYSSGSLRVLRASPGYPSICFSDGYFED